MATNPAEVTPEAGAETEEKPNPQAPEAGAENEAAEETEADRIARERIEAVARDIGWKPPEEYNGPGEPKSAEEFIKAGRDISAGYKAKLNSLEQQMSAMSRTSAAILEQQVQERVSKLTADYNAAVEDGDAKRAFDLSQQIIKAEQTPSTLAPSGPPPEAQEFAERNAGWFNKPGFEYFTAKAVSICNDLAGKGYPPSVQLQNAENVLRQEAPQLFKAQANGFAKPAPGVHAPASRGAPPPSNRAKGFSDMPKPAQDVAKSLVEQGTLPNVDAYVKNYWREVDRKA